MEIILFAGVIVILFWVGGISNRLSSLEKQLKTGVNPSFSNAAKVFSEEKPFLAPRENIVKHEVGEQIPLKPHATEEENAASWLSKIGILALLFGIAFFFKYAIDQGWIGQWTRIIIGLSIGGLLIILGNFWREKYTKYAAVLMGGGAALIYFSFFASYQFYRLLPQSAALMLMVFTSILAVFLARREKTPILAALGVCASYIAPLLLHSGTSQQIGLFAFITLLNIACLAVTFSGFWPELLYFSFIGTIINYSFWSAEYSTRMNTYPSFIFLAVNFLIMMLGMHLLYRQHLQQPQQFQSKERIGFLPVAWGLFYTLATYSLLNRNFDDILPLVGFLGAAISFLCFVLIYKLENRGLNLATSFVGFGLMVLTLFWWDLSGNATAFLISSLGILSIVLGAQLARMELRVWGIGILILGSILALIQPYDRGLYVFLLNAKFGIMFFASAGLIFTGWLYHKFSGQDMEKNADDLANTLGAVMLLIAVSWEIIMQYSGYEMQNSKNLLLSMWWIVYAVVLMLVGSLPGNKIFRKVAIGLFALSILKVFLYDVQALELGFRVVSFIVLGVILLGVSFAYQKNKEKVTAFLKANE